MKVLCVDDEPQVVAGLALHLRRRFEPLHASSGEAGLEMLRNQPDIAIVISDMRMPGMDGATFLSHVRKNSPDVVRVLLTGQADMESAIAAINQGQIFRFLTKPCPPPALMGAMEAAAEHYRLITSERILLDHTLRGSLKAVTDVLALTSPLAFGCAMRVKHLVTDLAAHLEWPHWWQVDVAAMLCQLGSISLPAATAEKFYYGREISAEEAEMVARTPAITQQLLASIPRLEVVLAILGATTKPCSTAIANAERAGSDEDIVRKGAELLKAAIDFDALSVRGLAPTRVIDTMRGRRAHYDAEVLNALHALRATGHEDTQTREVPVSALAVGMVLADEVRTVDGMLLSARGLAVTAGLVERIRNDRRGIAHPTVRIRASTDERRAAS